MKLPPNIERALAMRADLVKRGLIEPTPEHVVVYPKPGFNTDTTPIPGVFHTLNPWKL